MIFLKLIQKFIKLLNSDADPGQMAGGFVLGSIIGLTPFFSLHNLGIWILIFLLKVNVGAAFLGLALFSIIGLFLDPFADAVGYYVLADIPALHPFWTSLYNMPVVPLFRFNNTIVMGSFIIALILSLPLLIGMKKFVVVYREKLKTRFEKFKIFQILKASKLYQWYNKIRQ
ncbi:MAG: TIGR03546 family protein [Elusimicrobia bacterium]|nr:TIGR03546 family protein [Elusimicrobiota bacterium]